MMSSPDLLSSLPHLQPLMHPNEVCIKLIRSVNGVHITSSYDAFMCKKKHSPLLLRFQTQKETRISYPSNNSRHLPYSIPDAIGIKHKTNSSHPSVARFSLLQNCNHYKKSSQPSTVIEHSLSSRNTWERFPSHNETKARSDPKSLCVLFTSTFLWPFDDSERVR